MSDWPFHNYEIICVTWPPGCNPVILFEFLSSFRIVRFQNNAYTFSSVASLLYCVMFLSMLFLKSDSYLISVLSMSYNAK